MKQQPSDSASLDQGKSGPDLHPDRIGIKFNVDFLVQGYIYDKILTKIRSVLSEI